MGYIKHRAAIAVVYENEQAVHTAMKQLIEELKEGGEKTGGIPQCVLGPVVGINGYTTYVFVPDGSKEGWNASDSADAYRARFIDIAQQSSYPSVVELSFGGDDAETRVEFTTDYNTPPSRL